MSDELNTCKLCGEANTRIEEVKYWTGMSYKTVNFKLIHWCTPANPDIRVSLVIRAPSKEALIEFWNS